MSNIVQISSDHISAEVEILTSILSANIEKFKLDSSLLVIESEKIEDPAENTIQEASISDYCEFEGLSIIEIEQEIEKIEQEIQVAIEEDLFEKASELDSKVQPTPFMSFPLY